MTGTLNIRNAMMSPSDFFDSDRSLFRLNEVEVGSLAIDQAQSIWDGLFHLSGNRVSCALPSWRKEQPRPEGSWQALSLRVGLRRMVIVSSLAVLSTVLGTFPATGVSPSRGPPALSCRPALHQPRILPPQGPQPPTQVYLVNIVFDKLKETHPAEF